jgi:hypothetical protein
MTVAQALRHLFLEMDGNELTRLYANLVVGPWEAREMILDSSRCTSPAYEMDIDSCEFDETAAHQTILTRVDGNANEMKERKRLLADGKENDSQTKEDGSKRRKIEE